MGLPYKQGRLSSCLQRRVFNVFTEENCPKAFETVGLVPINAQVVFVRVQTQKVFRYERKDTGIEKYLSTEKKV